MSSSVEYTDQTGRMHVYDTSTVFTPCMHMYVCLKLSNTHSVQPNKHPQHMGQNAKICNVHGLILETNCDAQCVCVSTWMHASACVHGFGMLTHIRMLMQRNKSQIQICNIHASQETAPGWLHARVYTQRSKFQAGQARIHAWE